MKIIKVEFENLNSLKGYWSIDFTDSNYEKNHNQFVICGETASGKTTILDAITLALYGKTPREKVTDDSNEIMCKGTGSCMSAVTYECSKGVYRSEFKQHRADHKPGGKLQAPSCSIKNLINGENVDGVKSIKSIQAATGKIINLDYEQFCKSMLLAQGSFDKFLTSDERGKAEILAKLNGTQDFKVAANQLWLKANRKIAECNEKIGEADRIKLLTDDEKNEYIANKADYKKKIDENTNLRKSFEDKIKWKTDLETKKKAYDEADRRYSEAKNDEKCFEDNARKLESAVKAAKCEAVYKVYASLSQENLELEAKYKKLNEEHSENSENLKQADVDYKRFSNELENVKKKENKALWDKVSNLDAEIKTSKALLDNQNNRYNEIDADYKSKCDREKKIQTENAAKNQCLAEIDEYLSAHADDSKLVDIIPKLDSHCESLSSLGKNIGNNLAEKEIKGNKLSEANSKLAEIDDFIRALEDELKQFVSSNYKSISKALRSSCLDTGKACPVCGSTSHPFCEENLNNTNAASEADNNTFIDSAPSNSAPDTNTETSKTDSVAARALELSEAVDAKIEEKGKCEKEITVLETSLDTIVNSIAKDREEFSNTVNDINVLLEKWNLKLETDRLEGDSSNLDRLIMSANNNIECIRKLSSVFIRYEEEKARIQVDLQNNSEILNSLDLVQAKKKLDEEEAKKQQYEGNYKKLADERETLFGDADVESVRNKYAEELNTAEKNKSDSFEKYNRLNTSNEIINTQLNDNKNALQNNKAELLNAENDLRATLTKNGFNNLDELKDSRLPEEIIKELSDKQEKIKISVTRAKENFETATKAYEDHKSKPLTEEEIDVLEHCKADLDEKIGNFNKEIGRITEILDKDDAEAVKKKQLLKDNVKYEEERKMYEKIRTIIGIQSGDDVEVFVQRMALDNLLNAANSYLEQMFPDYSLVKKTDCLDFVVHDISESTEGIDRPISNMSGGERFSISLSLALALAEIASHRVQVDSLFLDEGFGTLSGAPLNQAIDALKRLQSTGKTLGIITHVQPVIDEFDQKITAIKRNGVSTLSGDGIVHLDKAPE